MPETMITATLTGSLLCVLLLIFKNKLLSLLGGRFLYTVSLLAMLTFLLPINIRLITIPKAPDFTVTEPAADGIVKSEVKEPAAVSEEMKPNYVAPVLPSVSENIKKPNPVTVQELLLAVWLAGFVFSLSRYLVSYFRFRRKVCSFEVHETIKGVEIVKSPLVSSPMLFGFFKATLAIPEAEMDSADYELALHHEMVHYRRRDSWRKLFAVFVNAVHWFNPITYLMVGMIGEACEYACDETVVKEMDQAERKQYSEMILSMVCQSSPALSSNMVKNKKQLKRRFEMIMKKKRFSVFGTVICMVLMLALACGSVALANEAAPWISGVLKDDYVYITCFGNGDYNDFIPLEKDGVYYLPYREFLNACNIEDDKIRYDDGTVTVDVWSNAMEVVNVFTETGEREIYPAEYVWSTGCSDGSREVLIDGQKVTLQHAPYIEDGITYVPYEYIAHLHTYEDGLLYEGRNAWTHKFTSVMLYAYDSFRSEYRCDDINADNIPWGDDYCYDTYHGEAVIGKTGYRTDFHMKFDFTGANNKEETGRVEVILNEVTRIYSKGSDIEGLFTVTIDGEAVYENEKGYITNMPVPAGEGVLYHSETTVQVGELKTRIFFFGYGNIDAEYSRTSTRNREVEGAAGTKKVSLPPSEVKLNGVEVNRCLYQFLSYNIEESYANMSFQFDYFDEAKGEPGDTYEINRGESHGITVIDENTFAGHFFLLENLTRIDSFDAVITLSPDNNTFEFRSNDGRYIIRGAMEEYIPLWERTEEQKQQLPKFIMI